MGAVGELVEEDGTTVVGAVGVIEELDEGASVAFVVVVGDVEFAAAWTAKANTMKPIMVNLK